MIFKESISYILRRTRPRNCIVTELMSDLSEKTNVASVNVVRMLKETDLQSKER